MISDPRTTPDSRAGRILFAFLVALGAWVVTTQMYRTNGLLWSLAAFSLAVPAIDRWLPGARYRWERPATGARPRGEPDETHVRGLAAAGRARAVAAARP